MADTVRPGSFFSKAWAWIGHVSRAFTVWKFILWACPWLGAAVVGVLTRFDGQPWYAVLTFAFLSLGGLAILSLVIRQLVWPVSTIPPSAQQPVRGEPGFILRDMHALGSLIENIKEKEWKSQPRFKHVYDHTTSWHATLRQIEDRLQACATQGAPVPVGAGPKTRRVRYVREVFSPDYLRGAVGEVRELSTWDAERLTGEGYVAEA